MAGSGWKGNIKLEWLGLGQVGRRMSSENGKVSWEGQCQVRIARSGVKGNIK